MQIRDCQDQLVQVVCEKVLVYKADVQEHLIVGCPFYKAYGLMVDPTRDLLVDALCGPENRTNERCPVASGQCACRAVPVKQKKVSRVKSYVARLIGLASNSDEEPAVPRAPYVSAAAVVSVAAVHTAHVLPVVAAVVAASCSAALLCFGSGPTEKQAGLSTCPDRPQGKCEHNSRCTECVHECVCARGKHQGLPDPELVRRQHCTEDEASDQGLTNEESHSEFPPSITQPLETAPLPDSFAGGWGNFTTYSGPWRAQEQGLEWLQQPDAALLDNSQSLRHFCACAVEELCDHCCPRPCEVPECQQKQDPLQICAQASTSLLSSKLRARFSEQSNKLHLSAMQRRVKLRKRVRQQASYTYASGRQMLLPGVRDEILNWAGLREAKFIDAFASKQTALFSKHWDEKANTLVQDWSYGTPEKGDHTDFFCGYIVLIFCCSNQ